MITNACLSNVTQARATPSGPDAETRHLMLQQYRGWISLFLLTNSHCNHRGDKTIKSHHCALVSALSEYGDGVPSNNAHLMMLECNEVINC